MAIPVEDKNSRFVTVSEEYLMDLTEKAKVTEYFRGRVEGLEYVIDSIEAAFKGNSQSEWEG